MADSISGTINKSPDGSTPPAPTDGLAEADRQKLDGIVGQMMANQEPEENILAVVQDFKQKYSFGARAASRCARQLTLQRWRPSATSSAWR